MLERLGQVVAMPGTDPLPNLIQQTLRLIGVHAFVRRSKTVPGRGGIGALTEDWRMVLYGPK